jgi:signal transduction histidine kinase/ActR/RegA family two-component response regulator
MLQQRVRNAQHCVPTIEAYTNYMNTIHDGGAGSEAARMRAALIRERRARALLGRTKDALEAILGAGCVGFCRIGYVGRRLRANPHFKAHFGWPPDATLERSDLDARVHEDDRAALGAAVTAALEEGTPLDLTVRAVWPCGTTQYIALRGRCELADTIESAGARKRTARGLVLVANNVTAEHRALKECEAAVARESELRTRAETANRSNLELLSLVSHELRSPLNALLGWNRILAIKRGDDPEVKAKTVRIEHSARAQLRIVNDLLDFGRMGTGKFKINKRPMKLATVAATALEAAGAAACAKEIELTADLAATAGELNGDAERLRQVVTHVLSNALKFTPRGGKVHVCLRRDGTDIVFDVTDTGQGIAPERLAHVFERVRAENSYGAPGLGLGLSLAREIVALHGGSVRVASDGVGRGAQVAVRLPARVATNAYAEPGATKALMSVPRSLDGLAILVVDDEPDARTVVAELLRLEGAEVTVCDSAASAYEKLCAQGAGFDVVVTDIGMPVEDGYSLVRKLRALKSGTRVLAIALTGYATTSDGAAALEAGFDLHVAKPVDFERFVPMIRRFSQHT